MDDLRSTLLWVTEEVPDHDGGGGAVRQAHLLGHLGTHFAIDLVVAGRLQDPVVRASVRSVTEVASSGTRAVGRARAVWELGVRRRSLAGVGSGPAVAALRDELRSRRDVADLALVHHENLLPLLRDARAKLVGLHVFDVKHVKARQAAAVSSGRRARLWQAEARASLAGLRRYLDAAELIVTCTAADLEAIQAAVPGGAAVPGVVAPNGVDLVQHAPTPPPGRAEVLLFGSLDYEPNVDGAVWFVGEVWPAVRRASSAARLVLAGRRPAPEVHALASIDGVELVGEVPDAAACYAAADVVVVPLRIGTGSRLKALEAMACGRPVVGTTVGLEGLDLATAAAPAAVVADAPAAFAAEVVRLIEDPTAAARLAEAGRAHVEARFGWEAIADRLAADLASATAAPTESPDPVTVLVCTRGRPALLPDCLAAIGEAMRAGDELLVVEADGRDAARDVEAIGASAHHIVAPTPGKSRQLNLGLRAAQHDIVVLTDDDCRVDPDWIAAMARPFADPTVGVVFGDVVGLSGVRGIDVPPLPPGRPPAVTWAYANGAAMAVRRAAAKAVGGYDERLGPGAPVHGEEHDLLLRLLEAGWTARIADAPPVQHLEWRDDDATRANLLTYSRGAGAFVGAALRRAPRRSARLLVRRGRYQASLWRHHEHEGWSFGPATTWAFARGLARGVLLRPKRFLEP